MPQLSLYLLEAAADESNRDDETQGGDVDTQAADPLVVRLPSTIPSVPRATICSAELLATEKELRIAQADSSLDSVRLWLRHQTHGFQFKRKNVSGQRAVTKAYSKIQKVAKNIRKAARTYRIARQALVDLGVNLTDEASEYRRFKVLLESDLRSPTLDKEPTKRLADAREMMGEGTVVRSWIWDHMHGKDSGVNEDGMVGGGKLVVSIVPSNF
jgi:hypothetical protein